MLARRNDERGIHHHRNEHTVSHGNNHAEDEQRDKIRCEIASHGSEQYDPDGKKKQSLRRNAQKKESADRNHHGRHQHKRGRQPLRRTDRYTEILCDRAVSYI